MKKRSIRLLLSALLVLVMAFQSIAAPLSYAGPTAASEPAKITGTWSMDASGSWHFNAPDGAAKDGWYYLNTTNNATDYNWFCFDANGVMRTGWVPDKNDPSVWYYTGETKDSSEGGLVKGWATDPRDGKRYYMDPSTGIMRYGWQLIGNVWYYFGEKQYSNASHPYGAMYLNEKTPDGYYVGSNGAWVQNHSEDDNSDKPDPIPEYSITVENDGNGTASSSAKKSAAGKEITLTAVPNEGYQFKEWVVESGDVAITENKFTMPAENVTVKAVFEEIPAPVKYTVTFDLNGITGTAPEAQEVAKGGKVTKPTDPTADGYTFGGWYKEAACTNAWSFDTDTVTADTTLYAKWTIVPSTYGIIVEGDGHGTASATVGGKTVTAAAANAEVTLTATPNEGYRFKEWNVVSGGVTVTENKFTMPANNVTVQAVFEAVPETKKLSEILPAGFPESADTAWVNAGGQKAYKNGENIKVGNLTLGKDTTVTKSGDNYACKSGDATVTFNVKDGAAESITVTGSGDSNGTYTAPETKKLSEILPSGFPTSADSAWVNANNQKAYKDGTNIIVGNLTLGADTTVTKSGDNYVCKSGDATVTFNIKDGAAESITVTGSSDSNGTYTAPTFKAVYNTTGDVNTLTFYYDNKDHSGENITVYEGSNGDNYLFDNSKSNGKKWGYNGNRGSIKSVVVDASVAGYKGLKSTTCMFQGMTIATNISGAEHLDVSNVTDMSYMFYNFGCGSANSHTTLNSVPDVSKWNTAYVENMTGMFWAYGNFSDNLTKVPDVSKWNTANVTNMAGMFQQYGHESENFNAVPDVSKWNTGKVTDMHQMFYEYGHKSTVLDTVPDVSKWNTASVKIMNGMFESYGNSSTALTAVPDVSNWNTGNVTTILNMFQNFGNVSVDFVLDLSGWDLSKITGTNGNNVFNFNPKTFDVTIPAKTGEKSNESDKWYYGNGTNHIAPPEGKNFTPAAPEIKYMDWDGEELVEKSTSKYTEVKAETTELVAGNFYIVKGADVQTGTLTVTGDGGAPTLILMDGAKLTATGSSNNAGIQVASGKALVITGQSGGTGTLIANGQSGAGIGGGDYGEGGTVTINGGMVTATGGASGAGIGGGNYGEGGTVTINGGTVTANGGASGAGIGGAIDKGGTVTINGGTVTATGGVSGAGIGGGNKGTGGTVTINGGTVTATGGVSGAGIGGGNFGDGGTVTINGGTVTANGGSDGYNAAAAIGNGCFGSNFGTVTFGEGVSFTIKAGSDAASATIKTAAEYAGDHSAAYVSIKESAPPAKLLKSSGTSSDPVNDAPMAETEVSEPTAEVFEPKFEPEKFEEAKPEELIEPAEAVAEKPIEDTEPDTPETMD